MTTVHATETEQVDAARPKAHQDAKKKGGSEIRIITTGENVLNVEASHTWAENAPHAKVNKPQESLNLTVIVNCHGRLQKPHHEINQQSFMAQRKTWIRETNNGWEHGQSLQL
jgi:hypothetical protein